MQSMMFSLPPQLKGHEAISALNAGAQTKPNLNVTVLRKLIR
jgi:hypothetical protein